ncbi:pimeloyl-ACP methyl ester carboxylesterase [Microbacterium sp. SLBN-154]|uniref:alpha/beta fold hydrolase n=1 Tax=Microbacterium sp. SLBN-154 TaxID=2768458 RepID=UPI001174448C|nr:alpha/beta hydrolase [Microbacterium sp. SLBN-154]TQK18827.1 pimeloyl-ACP methyl ester carboxylesterase [Microbacterium sp. SLBN-154]
MSERDPWFEERGSGPVLVALHPGGTDSRSLAPLMAHLDGYRLILVDRPGHGRSRDVAGEWSFDEMADSVAEVLAASAPEGAHIFGWSDGAIVGLALALRHPHLVHSLVFGGGVFHRDGWLNGVLDGEPPAFMADAYAEVSPDGAEHWPIVIRKAEQLHLREPTFTVEQLRTLVVPTLILVGDDDEVRVDHLLSMLEAVPDGELAVVPRATHGLIVEKPELVARLIRDFHADEKSDGVAPIRRATR